MRLMHEVLEALSTAAALVARLDSELVEIVVLSLRVSLTASLIALLIGAPLGAGLATARFFGRRTAIVIVNALLGLPPVVVGLSFYILLSHSGPLGFAELLYTPTAMVLAQTTLALPIVIALVNSAVEGLRPEYGDLLRTDGAGFARTVGELLKIARSGVLTAFLTAFGRAIAEVGAVIIVGGNIRGFTRTMTTSIALETSKGDLSLALALGLVLVVLSIGVSSSAFLVAGAAGGERRT